MRTPEAMYNAEGQKSWSCELSSYGRVRNFEGQTKTDCPFRYQGQYEDAETGLYYNRFRYYSPDEGIYISQDPIRLKGGHTLYSYVFDINEYIDPFGLSTGSTALDNGYTIRPTDLSGGPHAPDSDRNVAMSRSSDVRNSTAQGQWNSEDAVIRAASQYDPSKGMNPQVVDIRPGDGVVVHGRVGSYPPDPHFGSHYVVEADRAILIERDGEIHLFPIDETHPQYDSNYTGCPAEE